MERHCTTGALALNGVSATLVVLYLLVIFPPEEDPGLLTTKVAILASVAYFTVAALWGIRRAHRTMRPVLDWLRAERPPTAEERRQVVALPLRLSALTFVTWFVGMVAMSLLALDFGKSFAMDVAGTITVAGITTTAADFLIAERAMRPVVARALTAEPPEARSLGIGPRLILTWVLCSAVPILGIMSIPIGRLPDQPEELAAPVIFVSAIALIVGFIGTKLATIAVTRPIRSLRRAVDAVAEGDLDVHVEVDDGSELGRLQAGFNSMVAGLRERERIRDLLGRHVGAEVANEMIERGTALGGETREVSVLFVDLVGSTAYAQSAEPQQVVRLLNRFFETVVAVVHEHGGLVNKFEGDAALCVFGAPAHREDHAAAALRVARALRVQLGALDGELSAAIGVTCGEAVAGYVGAEERFEYTVVGDPVNEASRLTEYAKSHPARLVASGVVVECAGEEEARQWQIDGEVVLRGRSVPTRIAVLAGTSPAALSEAFAAAG